MIGAERVLAPGAEAGSAPDGLKQAKAKAVARFEAGYIRDMLRLHEGNISRAARAAGKNRRAFFELIRKHRIDAPESRRICQSIFGQGGRAGDASSRASSGATSR